jgi:hypothetical protein
MYTFWGFRNGSTAMDKFWGFQEWFYCNVYVLGVSGMVLLQKISFGGFWNGSTAMYKFWGFLEWFYCTVLVLGGSGMVLLQCIRFGGPQNLYIAVEPFQKPPKLIHCSRTIPEIPKTNPLQ